jgi:hypothetical protein
MITFCIVLLLNGSSYYKNDGMLGYSYGIGGLKTLMLRHKEWHIIVFI